MTVAAAMARNARWLNLSGFLSCTAMMAYALYAEYVLFLMPCPLCVLQRLATITLGVVFLLAAVHNPDGAARRVYALLLFLSASAGIGVAGRHLWLQYLPADEVPTCGPGFDYIIDRFPLSEALRVIFAGSGECAEVDWLFLGLSMPAWVLICFATLLVLGLAANLLRKRPAAAPTG